MAGVKHEPIREHFLFGERFTKGDRMVEVIKTDTCNETWMVYATIYGRVVKAQQEDPETRKQCMSWKDKFLAHSINPETW